MAVSPLSAALPQAPFIDAATGDIAVVWRQFLVALWQRTGRGPGLDSANPTLQAQLAAETQQRQTADTALTAAIGTETARAETAESDLAHQISVERQSRATDDMLGDANAQKLVNAERDARIAADALLVSIAALCTTWAACNLNFLPTSDPGGGKPWILDNHLVVGLPPTAIGIEAGVDQWIIEDVAGGNWQWG
jgi:hypothetical protein